jgi:hypothetical protein
MKKRTLYRVLAAIVLNLAVFEFFEQISVHWRESSQEKLLLPQLILVIATMIWVAAPLVQHIEDRLDRVALLVLVGILASPLMYVPINIYAWHIRPNVGLYQESDWVAQNPGFQRQLRARIEANRWPWNRPAAATGNPRTLPS